MISLLPPAYSCGLFADVVLLVQQTRRGKIAIATGAHEGPAPAPNNARRGSILKVTEDPAAIAQPRELLKVRFGPSLYAHFTWSP